MASVQALQNFINGEFVSCNSYVDSYNPATGEIYLKVPRSEEKEVQVAVEAAQHAFKKSVLHGVCDHGTQVSQPLRVGQKSQSFMVWP